MVQILSVVTYVLVLTVTRGDDTAVDQCTSDLKECNVIDSDASGDHKYSEEANKLKDDILVFTVATSETDGFQRYMFSANEYGIKPNILGMGEKWKGGENVKSKPGGGWKITLLKSAVEPYKDDKEKIILYTDAYDVIFLTELKEIVEKFKSFGVRVLFGAESICWPKEELAALYPAIETGKKYLNSGVYMGYAPEIYRLLTRRPIKDDDDDQLYFTEAYLDAALRENLDFNLDHTSEIFQNLNGSASEVELVSEDQDKDSYKILRNIVMHTKPLIVHGNGPSKIYLNNFGNYLAKAFHPVDGCRHCKHGEIDLTNLKELPIVLMGIFIEDPTPFLEEHLEKIYKIDYPKNRMHLFIHNAAKYHNGHVSDYIKKYGTEYLSLKEIKPEDETTEWTARDLSLDLCLQKKCEFYFVVDSIAHVDNPKTLQLLIQQNRTIVAPLMTRPGKAWSNFWGALTVEGYYARSPDYMEIVHNRRRGLWNVPFINHCYLVNTTIFQRHDRSKIKFVRDNLDADMAFCANLRDLDVFLYISNREDYGHLINPDTYDITMAEPDMYQIFENEKDWEKRYIHPEYKNNFLPEKTPIQPCPDVYWWPIVTERFCDELVHMMENYGKWSSGTNYDERLEGGYEAVPTRDIHMNQVGWEKHWLEFLNLYVRPLTEYVYTGYSQHRPRSLMNFVVKYRPDGQPNLKPHHDTSTYTINVALNHAGIDYDGGGCRFVRYNCSVTDTKKGWMLMHPGKLTHLHEGLYVTRGTRYIMVAFIDP